MTVDSLKSSDYEAILNYIYIFVTSFKLDQLVKFYFNLRKTRWKQNRETETNNFPIKKREVENTKCRQSLKD